MKWLPHENDHFERDKIAQFILPPNVPSFQTFYFMYHWPSAFMSEMSFIYNHELIDIKWRVCLVYRFSPSWQKRPSISPLVSPSGLSAFHLTTVLLPDSYLFFIISEWLLTSCFNLLLCFIFLSSYTLFYERSKIFKQWSYFIGEIIEKFRQTIRMLTLSLTFPLPLFLSSILIIVVLVTNWKIPLNTFYEFYFALVLIETSFPHLLIKSQSC